MYTKNHSCVDITLILNKMGIHPLEVVNASISHCVTGFTSDQCLDKNLPSTFREDLAKAINDATQSIADLICEYPCPTFIEGEEIDYKSAKRGRSYYRPSPMKDAHGNWKEVSTKFPMSKSGVRRAELIQANVPVQYIDSDGDGYRETALVEWAIRDILPYDICQVYAFFPDRRGNEHFRIRPRVDAEFTDSLDILLTYNSWDLIKPEVLHPTLAESIFHKNPPKLNLCCDFTDLNTVADPDNCPFVDVVDIYRVYVDNETQCPATIHYAKTKCQCGSNQCLTKEEGACIKYVGNKRCIQVIPASIVNEVCTAKKLCTCEEPDYICVNYLTICKTCIDDECIDFDAVCHFDALYWLALARMSWKDCGCEDRFIDLSEAQKMPLKISPIDGFTTPVGHPDINNKNFTKIVLGNLVGERKAWGLLKQFLEVPKKKRLAVY